MENKSVIIIGAGIAGLCAGSYLQMNGYNTQIFELHNIPGGLCTAWKRKGYTFDGCIHWLVGSSPSNSFHKLWNELGAVRNTQMIEFDEFTKVEYEKDKYFTVYTDANKLEAEMKRIAPEDAKLIEEFTGIIKKLSNIDMPVDKAQELSTPIDIAKFLITKFPVVRIMGKYGKMTIVEYAKRFKSPVFKNNFPILFNLYDSFPAAVFMMMLAWMHQRSAGYPIGGSLKFARSIENTFINLGGKVNYNSMVTKILVENNKAVGIELQNGETYKADIVISAADGHYTIFKMLESKYIDDEITNNYKHLELFPPIIQLSLGISKTFDGISHSLSFLLDEPIIVDDKNKMDRLNIRIYNFDPTMAPEGKTSITSFFDADLEYWLSLKSNSVEKYRKEKERIAAEVISALDKKLGDIKSNVEVFDVATPVTYIRYTNNWKASWEGWLPTTKSYTKRIKKTLPGLDNFYMIGQWVQPGGGLPTGIMTGRDITQIICKKDGRKFHTI